MFCCETLAALSELCKDMLKVNSWSESIHSNEAWKEQRVCDFPESREFSCHERRIFEEYFFGKLANWSSFKIRVLRKPIQGIIEFKINSKIFIFEEFCEDFKFSKMKLWLKSSITRIRLKVASVTRPSNKTS